jgi:hypothetical protein
MTEDNLGASESFSQIYTILFNDAYMKKLWVSVDGTEIVYSSMNR